MEFKACYSEQDLINLIIKDFNEKFNLEIENKDINILVKSQQNYKSEWEKAEFKATISKIVQ